MKGLVHIYEGDGKGKTTAGVGLAIRCAGCGFPVVYAQFLKDGSSGEINILRNIPEITVKVCTTRFGFTFHMDAETKIRAKEAYEDLFRQAVTCAEETSCRLLVLDEILDACNRGLLDSGLVTGFLKNRPGELEVVLTGREPGREFTEFADYITVMKKVRHPFTQGIPARKGIEM